MLRKSFIVVIFTFFSIFSVNFYSNHNSYKINSAHAVVPEFPSTLNSPGIGIPGSPVLHTIHPDSPANMVKLHGLRLGFTGMESLSGLKNPWEISGEGLFFIWRIPFINMAIGGGSDILRTRDTITGRLYLSLGALLSPSLSWGARYSRIISPTFENIEVGDFSFALNWQPLKYVNLAYQVESLFMEKQNGIPSERIHRTELSIGEKNKIWSGFSLSERRGDWSVSGGLRVETFKGLYLYGNASFSSLNRQYFTTSGVSESFQTPSGFYVGAGVSLQMERLNIAIGGGGPDAKGKFSLIWDEKPYLNSIIPDPQYAILLTTGKKYDEKIHFKNMRYLHRCMNDNLCKGVVIKAGDSDIGWAWAEEWSREIWKLRQHCKKVVVYGFSFSNSTYAMVSTADKIIIYPGGSVDLTGLKMTKLFLAEGLGKLGISAQFIRYGKYKSAPEMFMNRSPTKESIKGMSSLLGAVDRRFKIMVLRRKGMNLKKLQKILLESSLTPIDAVKLGVVDSIRYTDQMDHELTTIFGKRIPVFDPSRLKKTDITSSGIGVLLLEGEIVVNPSLFSRFTGNGKFIRMKRVSRALSIAAHDPRIKAIVLRVNSPGGSALASDILWRQVSKINRIKPVIVSFGNYATSGGYYISAAAKRIFSEGATITGSIGIFGGKFSIKGLLNKIGIGTFTMKQAPHADLSSSIRPYTPEEILKMQKSLKYSYNRFLSAVSSGRKIPIKSLYNLAGGRVWSGEQALKRKLIDSLGGINDAIAYAIKITKLSNNSSIYVVYPSPMPLWKSFIKNKLGIPIPSTSSKINNFNLKSLKSAENGPWMRLPFNLLLK